MIVGITGHRPEKIPAPAWVIETLGTAYEITRASKVLQGMAAGVDLWSAKEAWYRDIPYVCVKPWAGHKPRVADRIEYDKVIKHSFQVVNVTEYEEYPGAWVYQKRNEWIVDEVDAMIAVWDGSRSGTGNCVEYANDNDIPVFQINPMTRKVGWLNFTPQRRGSGRDSW